MKTFVIALVIVMTAFTVYGAEALFQWDFQTTYDDGTPVTPTDRFTTKFFLVSGGTYSLIFTTAVSAQSYTVTVPVLPNRVVNQCYAVTCTSQENGLESGYSNTVCKDFLGTRSRPRPPVLR